MVHYGVCNGIDTAKVAEIITARETAQNYNEALDRLGYRAKESIHELYEAMHSTFGGSHLFVCMYHSRLWRDI